MKFQIAKRDLQQAFSVVSGALASAEGDIASHFLFRINPNDPKQLEVHAAINRMLASCPVAKAEILEPGEYFTLEGWRIQGWLGIVGDGVLVVEHKDGVTTCTLGKFTQQFQTLDPKDFPVWDNALKTAEMAGTVTAKRLAAALSAAKEFTAQDESSYPEVVAVNLIGGILQATDKRKTVACFFLEELKDLDCNIRMHYKDLPAIVAFLEGAEGKIEILNHDRYVFLRREDGAVYGEARWMNPFPNLAIPDDTDQRTWKVQRSELRQAAMAEHFGAEKKDVRLFLKYDAGQLRLSMHNVAAKKAKTTAIDCIEVVNNPAPLGLAETGFPVSFTHILAVLDKMDSPEVTLGVNVVEAKKTRYLRVKVPRFADDKGNGGDTYVYILAGMLW